MTPLNVSTPAVVLGVEHPRGLTVLRSLGSAGVAVDVLDRYPTSPGLRSRWARRAHLLDTDSYAETLAYLEAIDVADGAVLIATNDHYMGMVAANHDRLSKRFTLTTSGWDALEPALDKAALFRIARSIGLATPEFFTPATPGELEDVLRMLDFGRQDYFFCLPPTSPEPADPDTVRYTTPAGRDPSIARARARDLLARSGIPPMIQATIPGTAAHCLGVVLLTDDTYRTVASRVVRRQKLYPYFRAGGHEYGGNVRCESVHDDEAVAAASTLAATLRLKGVVTVEFRRRPSDNVLLLMKIDPRVVGMVGLCADLGFDVPTAVYRQATGQPISVPVSYQDGLGWLWEKPFLYAMVKSQARSWRAVPATVAAFWGATRFGVWSARDPQPFLASIAGGVRAQVRQRFLRERARREPPRISITRER